MQNKQRKLFSSLLHSDRLNFWPEMIGINDLCKNFMAVQWRYNKKEMCWHDIFCLTMTAWGFFVLIIPFRLLGFLCSENRKTTNKFTTGWECNKKKFKIYFHFYSLLFFRWQIKKWKKKRLYGKLLTDLLSEMNVMVITWKDSVITLLRQLQPLIWQNNDNNNNKDESGKRKKITLNHCRRMHCTVCTI